MYEVPVKEGDQFEVKIEAIGDKGDGIAKKDGFVLVIPNTKLNDVVTIKVTRVLKKVGFAEVVSAGSKNSSSDDESYDDMESDDEPEIDTQKDSEDF